VYAVGNWGGIGLLKLAGLAWSILLKAILTIAGTYDQIKQTCKSYRVYFSTPPEIKPGQDYLVDHSIYFYLMGTSFLSLTLSLAPLRRTSFFLERRVLFPHVSWPWCLWNRSTVAILFASNQPSTKLSKTEILVFVLENVFGLDLFYCGAHLHLFTKGLSSDACRFLTGLGLLTAQHSFFALIKFLIAILKRPSSVTSFSLYGKFMC